MFRKKLLLSLALLTIAVSAFAQKTESPNASFLYQRLQRLNVLGSVLYMAAHPDDENTALIAYFANVRQYRTGYLSLTRGDGGQDLLGPEMREKLGLIRTQELLQARNMDGGVQFFTRANDFGFTKNPEEVFTKWNRQQILADAVWVIRNFRPDVIITRFPKDARAGHGQHSASSILAEEAFEAAGDSSRFPEQLRYVQPWQAKRLVWNTSRWGFRNDADFQAAVKNILSLDIQKYLPLQGKSIGELAAESRSMHESQAFGSAGNRNDITEYFEPTKGASAHKDLFEDINTTWQRLPGSDSVAYYIGLAIQHFQMNAPETIVPALLNAYEALYKLPDSYYRNLKLQELKEVIKDCLGLRMEALADRKWLVPGDSVSIHAEIANRSSFPISVDIRMGNKMYDTIYGGPVNPGKIYRLKLKEIISPKASISVPYWLDKPWNDAMYAIEDQKNVGKPWNDPVLNASVRVRINSVSLDYQIPVVYKKVDPAKGEIYSPLSIVPKAFVNLNSDVYIFPNGQEKKISVGIQSNNDNLHGRLHLRLPEGWTSRPSAYDINIQGKEEHQDYSFTIVPTSKAQNGNVVAQLLVGNDTIDRSLVRIKYEHIPEITYMPLAKAAVVNVSVVNKSKHVGYLMGAGDDVPGALRQIGVDIKLLSDADFDGASLVKYDAIVVGVRAFNTLDKIAQYSRRLMQYVHEGGTVIVQYNVNRGLIAENLGPYPIHLSTNRVTDENAAIQILQPQSPLLTFPNKITAADFAGWVQERGLYFPDSWDSHYHTVIASHDPKETGLDGGILWMQYGKGYYIYSCYDWFRELPAGVPGAYRIFANMLSIGKNKKP